MKDTKAQQARPLTATEIHKQWQEAMNSMMRQRIDSHAMSAITASPLGMRSSLEDIIKQQKSEHKCMSCGKPLWNSVDHPLTEKDCFIYEARKYKFMLNELKKAVGDDKFQEVYAKYLLAKDGLEG